MKKLFPLLFGLIAPLFSFSQHPLPKSFSDKIAKYGLHFTYPYGWETVPVLSNSVMPYDFAVHLKSAYEGKYCEIRYLILPPGKDLTAFLADAKSKICLQLFEAHESFVKLQPSEGDLTNKADWLTTFGSTQYDDYQFKKDFAQEFTDGNVVIMEKKGKARIVVMILRNKDNYACDDLSPELFYSLTF
ncbi:MAG: hypothetical protein K1X82_04200 [Bacteroidia bacterium]|nr:hypothetical protein [Bacteroidia bacterium]